MESPFLVGQYIIRLPEPMLSPEIQRNYIMRCHREHVSSGGKEEEIYSGCQNLRIWSDSNGLIYDNQLNAPDSDDPSTALGGGSIVISSWIREDVGGI